MIIGLIVICAVIGNGVMVYGDRREAIERGKVQPRTSMIGKAWEVALFLGSLAVLIVLALFLFEWMQEFGWTMHGYG